MSLADSLRALLIASIRKASDGELGPILLALMRIGAIEDRRAEQRPAEPLALPAPRVRTKGRKRPKRTCPVDGCPNVFSPRYGGFCADHRRTAGYKAWAKANARK